MPERMNETQIHGAVRMAVTGAVDFIDSELADERIKAQRYFNGEVDLETEEGRSAVISTKVRDTVRMVKPVLMRTFLQADKPVEFIPRGQDDVDAAEQATDYVSWKFSECDGYSILSDVFHDALIKKCGVAKVWWDDTEEVEFDEYSNLTPEQAQLVAMDPGTEVIEQTETPEGLINAKVALTRKTGRLRVKSIPPEDFFVDAAASSLEDVVVCGDRAEMVVGDLVEMGYDFDEVIEYAGTDDQGSDAEEDFERQGYSDEWDQNATDPTMRKIIVTEAYMRMDIEGTGIPRLYQFVCLGTNYKVIDYKLADQKPYAVFEIDPEPHTFFGRSLADILIHDQTAATSLLRGLIDNVHMTNNPRLVVNQQHGGNVEDAMNGEIGAILRANGDSMQAYYPLTVPFTAQATLPALQYYDAEIEAKTGVARSSLGMDADALQSTTAAGVNAAVQAASAAVELMARNLAEGGMRQTFRLMLKLSRQHANPNEVMRLNGRFVPVDPRSWSASMDLMTNVGLGTGVQEVRVMALRESLQQQMQIWSTYGPQNGLVSLTGIRNTIADIHKLSGVHNVDRYYNPMDRETEQMLLQQAAQAAAQQSQGSDPNAAFMQAEQMKAQARMQTDMAKLQANQQADMAKMQLEARGMMMEDDRKRDEMEQKAILAAAEMLGKFGIQVDDQRIRDLQSRQRA